MALTGQAQGRLRTSGLPLPSSGTARTSLRTGVCAALGIATADGLYALAATLGGTALAGVLRPVLGPLRWVCVLVLLVLAVWGAVTAVREYRGHRLATRTAPAPRDPAGPTWGCSASPC
ncbi:hypothetical protein SVIOM74S_08020 [Streptomyces violarus]